MQAFITSSFRSKTKFDKVGNCSRWVLLEMWSMNHLSLGHVGCLLKRKSHPRATNSESLEVQPRVLHVSQALQVICVSVCKPGPLAKKIMPDSESRYIVLSPLADHEKSMGPFLNSLRIIMGESSSYTTRRKRTHDTFLLAWGTN